MREVTIFETIETKAIRCDLGCEHKRAKVLRRYDLAVIESRFVENRWLAGYGRDDGRSQGHRAVDQFGDEWRTDWEFASSDGPSHIWHALDGRRAEEGLRLSRDDIRPPAYDGYIVVDMAGARIS